MDDSERIKKAHIICTELEKLFPEVKCFLNYKTDWQLLFAVMLSAQCTDAQVNKVTSLLFSKYPNLSDFVHISQVDLERAIFSTGFYRQKARNIRATALILQEKFHGKVPDSMEDLLSLPGVARKTANVVLGELYGIQKGIAVDTHVKRLAQVYGLTSHTEPNKIEKDLLEVIPENQRRAFTLRLIQYGRMYCPSRPHYHSFCPLVIALAKKQAQS